MYFALKPATVGSSDTWLLADSVGRCVAVLISLAVVTLITDWPNE